MLPRRRVLLEWVVIALALSLAVIAAGVGAWFSRVDATLYDRALGLWQRDASQEIVIIAIDEHSLAQIGRWPWQRPVHATLLDKLAQSKAKVIALDVMFTEPDRRDSDGERRDQIMADALARAQKVVIPVTERVEDGIALGVSLPHAPFAKNAAALGHTKAFIDPDGVVRTGVLVVDSLGARFESLGLSALRIADAGRADRFVALKALHTNPPSKRVLWEDKLSYLVPYVGPPGSYSQISYIDVLMPEFDVRRLDGKIVLVGMVASGLDEFPTPVSGLSRSMPGVEIHANIIQGISEGIELSRLPAKVTLVVSVALLVLAMVPFLFMSPRWSLLWTALCIVLVAGGTMIVFRGFSVWFSPSGLLLGLLLAYPLWSWRRLEATQRFFNEELQRLEREPSMIPLVASSADRGGDGIDDRIALLRAGTERLRNLKRFVSNTLESLPDAALVFDAEGNALLSNSKAEKVFGGQVSGQLIGKSFADLLADISPDDGRQWREILASSDGPNTPSADISTVVEAKHKDGHEFLVQVGPLTDESGARTGTIITLTDISPLRETERKRDEALRFLSHDMRSPQASILTLLEMRRSSPDAMTTEVMESRIEKYAKRTLNLADEFLRLARAERIKTADFVVLNLGELLRDAVDEAWALGEKKGIRVVFKDKTPDEAWVKAERDLLTRTVMNLLSNAIKYSPPDTTISVILAELAGGDAPQWQIDVADQGYGIAPEDLGKLFSRFTRIQREGQPQEDGIGLGLVFVKTVVARLGGSVSVASWIEDTPSRERGTTFTVVLPQAEAPAD